MAAVAAPRATAMINFAFGHICKNIACPGMRKRSARIGRTTVRITLITPIYLAVSREERNRRDRAFYDYYQRRSRASARFALVSDLHRRIILPRFPSVVGGGGRERLIGRGS
jgi:hypothetical protein